MDIIGTKNALEDEPIVECSKESLENLISSPVLKWIFVCGQKGVGKTTLSCALAVRLANTRKSVLLVSTGPGNNLSDVFRQTFTNTPTKVHHFDNLYAMQGYSCWVNRSKKVNEEDNFKVGQQTLFTNLDNSHVEQESKQKPETGSTMSFTPNVRIEEIEAVEDEAPSTGTGENLDNASMPASFEVESDDDEAPSTSTSKAPATSMKELKQKTSTIAKTATKRQISDEKIQNMIINYLSTHTSPLATVLIQIKKMDYSVVVFDTFFITETCSLMSDMKYFDEKSGTVPKVEKNDELYNSMEFMCEIEFDDMYSFDNANAVDFTKMIDLKLQLTNMAETSFISVCVPDNSTVRDTARFLAEMEAHGVDCMTVIMNRMTPDSEDGQSCATCLTKRKLQDNHVNKLCMLYKDLIVCRVPSVDKDLRGASAIRKLSNYFTPARPTDSASPSPLL